MNQSNLSKNSVQIWFETKIFQILNWSGLWILSHSRRKAGATEVTNLNQPKTRRVDTKNCSCMSSIISICSLQWGDHMTEWYSKGGRTRDRFIFLVIGQTGHRIWIWVGSRMGICAISSVECHILARMQNNYRASCSTGKWTKISRPTNRIFVNEYHQPKMLIRYWVYSITTIVNRPLTHVFLKGLFLMFLILFYSNTNWSIMY